MYGTSKLRSWRARDATEYLDSESKATEIHNKPLMTKQTNKYTRKIHLQEKPKNTHQHLLKEQNLYLKKC